jgi:hypothetical protein
MNLRRTNAEHDALKRRLLAHVASDGAPKEFCFREGVQIAWVYRMMRAMGIRFTFLTPDEQRVIAEHRSKRRIAA